MIVVPIQFKYVQIAKYSRDDSLLKICFNDGSKDHIIEKHSSDIGRVEEFVEMIISETRTMAKQSNAQKNAGMLGDVVSIRFTEDEETLYERLEVVFSRVKEELRKAKMAKDATNYLQTLSNLQGATFNI